MLELYDSKENINVIMSNDLYFDAHTDLKDTELSNFIINRIDKAERLSEKTFKGRSDKFGALDKQCLSTGTKTLLNILQNRDICFNISECGQNVLSLLPLIKEGKIYCGRYLNIPITDENIDCRIKFKGKVFNNLGEFKEFYEEIYDESHSDEF